MSVEIQNCPVVFKTTTPGYHFCGYYDVSPFDRSGRWLLTHRVREFLRMPEPDDVVELGIWDLETGDYRRLSETRAYNWQQGAKLQWLGPDFSGRVIFNDREDGQFVSRVVEVANGDTTTFQYPIYTVHPSGREAVCVNFERTYFPRPGYSYAGVVKSQWDVPIHPDDGLFRLDLATGSVERIVRTQDLLMVAPLSSMKGATHYLEHAIFNTDGSRIVFLHRWQTTDGGIYTRAYVCGPRGEALALLHDSGHFSHAGWRTPDELTAFAGVSTPFTRMRRHRVLLRWVLRPMLPLYRRWFSPSNPLRKRISGAHYLHFDVERGVCRQLDPNAGLSRDGHMTWHPTSRRWMLTDTYEDENFERRLLLYDCKLGKLYEIGRFYSTPSTCSTGWRCDLHPRFDHEGQRVAIDSMHENGERQVYVIDVSSLVGDGI